MRFISIVFCFLLTHCAKETQVAEVLSVRSGTTFGFCVGYCDKSLALDAEEALYIMNPTREADLPTRQCSIEVSDAEWAVIVQLVDVSFFELEETYGCPDCHDQGAEWIEVVTADRQHRVTFDPSMENSIHPLVDANRTWRIKIEETTPCN